MPAMSTQTNPTAVGTHRAEAAPTGTARPAPGYRRIVAGIALLVWPVLEFLAFVTSPPGTDHDPVIFRAQDFKVQISALLYLWAAMAFIPVVLGMAHLLRARLPRLSNIGATIGLLGTAHALTLFTTDFYDLALAHELPAAQAEQVTARANELWGFVYGMLLPSFLTHVGLFTLLAGLSVARIAPWWAVPVALVGTLIPFFTVEISPFAQSTGSLLHLVVYGLLALRVLRMSNEAWRDAAG